MYGIRHLTILAPTGSDHIQLPPPQSLAHIPIIPTPHPPLPIPPPPRPIVDYTPTHGLSHQNQGAVVILPALPPIPAKLVNKILSGTFVEMRELLSDNLMLRRQMEIQDEFSSSPHTVKPPLREVQSVTSWVCCMASYLAVLASADQLKPEHLAYLRLVVTEATKYKGEGWRTYDATFRQNMAAGAPGLSWSNIDAGLHAISFQAARGPPLCCPMCSESDHAPQDCALQATSSVRPRAFQSRPPRSFGALSRPAAGLRQPYSQTCFSWNNGECARFPSPCRYEHIGSRCARGGARRPHKAVDCRSPLSGATAGHHGVADPGRSGASASPNLPLAPMPARR